MWALGAVFGIGARQSSRGLPEDALADQDVVRRMAGHDPDALANLYDRYARLIYSLVLHILRDQAEAEDVVQDVFSQAWQQASRYEASRGTVGAWLLMMSRSRAIDRL